jgi:hypothetical protein
MNLNSNFTCMGGTWLASFIPKNKAAGVNVNTRHEADKAKQTNTIPVEGKNYPTVNVTHTSIAAPTKESTSSTTILPIVGAAVAAYLLFK